MEASVFGPKELSGIEFQLVEKKTFQDIGGTNEQKTMLKLDVIHQATHPTNAFVATRLESHSIDVYKNGLEFNE